MPPRSPTSTRTCSVKAPTPARASTTSTPSRRRSHGRVPENRRSSATTCSRASSPAPAWPRTSRSWRISRLAMTSPPLRHHRWARGDWQLLPWIFGRGPRRADRGRAAPSRDRPLEDARQPAAVAVGAGGCSGLDRRMGHAARRRGALDRFHPVDDRSAAPHSRASADIAPRRPGVTLRSHVRALGADLSRSSSRGSDDRFSGAPGLADGLTPSVAPWSGSW